MVDVSGRGKWSREEKKARQAAPFLAGSAARASYAVTEVAVSVIDSGEGIEERDLPRIFDRFCHGSNKAGSRRWREWARADDRQRHCRAARRQIWVQSFAGRGAQFTFVLPKIALVR
jgi:signal transduction histidine kinase